MEVCGGQTHTLIRQGIDQLLDGVGRARARARVPGLRHAARADRRGDRDREAARTRSCARSATCCACPGRARTSSMARAAGGDVARRVLAARRPGGRAAQPGQDRRVLRRRVRDDRARERDGRAAGEASGRRRTSRCSWPTCWCRPPSWRSSSRRGTACRGSSPPGTSARSKGGASTSRSRATSACRSWSRGSSRSTCWRASEMLVTPARGGPRRGGEPVRARGRARREPGRAAVVDEVFEVADRAWRGIGVIPASGLRLREAYAAARRRAPVPLRGRRPGRASRRSASRETSFAAGRSRSTARRSARCARPRRRSGAPMVSTEGACAAYFLAGRTREEASA